MALSRVLRASEKTSRRYVRDVVKINTYIYIFVNHVVHISPIVLLSNQVFTYTRSSYIDHLPGRQPGFIIKKTTSSYFSVLNIHYLRLL